MSVAAQPVLPLPSPRQLAWHQHGFYGFIHFTMNTFTGREWGYGDEAPGLFNPSALDARQWARVARDAGMKGLILTCKHHDGFCLWPSRYTEHSVKNAPWKNGRGDVVQECSDACREFGLKFGVYLSPWDRNHAGYGTPSYIEYYRNQMRELLTQYGPVFEVWLDGANGGDGYYGGAREVRKIDASTYYQWPETIAMVRELQPEAVIFSDGGPDIRWVGNESGEASLTNWCTLNASDRYPGYSPAGYNARQDLGVGHEGGSHWLPAEVDVSIRPGWFYHDYEDNKVRTPVNLLDLYLQSVGRGTNLLLNLPPDPRGLLPETDVANLLSFAQLRDLLFSTPIARTPACPSGESLPLATTGNAESLAELTFPATGECNLVLLREPIENGQRIKSWVLEADCNGWKTVAEGTTIGHCRLVQFPLTRTRALRLRIIEALAPAQLAAFHAYRAPAICREPAIHCDRDGMVSLIAGTDPVVIRYTLDGSEPLGDSPRYQAPIALPCGGVVRATIRPEDNPGVVCGGKLNVEARLGLAKRDWTIHSFSSDQAGHGEGADRLIDAQANTVWASDPSKPAAAEHPHFVTIDLGQEVAMGGFGYLPRQSHYWGMITRCSIAVSLDAQNWQTVAEDVAFDNIAANPILQVIRLSHPARGRFVKFIARNSLNGPQCASASGLEVFPATI